MKFPEKWKLGNMDRFVQPAKCTDDMFCIVFERCYSDRDAEYIVSLYFSKSFNSEMPFAICSMQEDSVAWILILAM